MNKRMFLKVLLGLAFVALLAGCVQIFEDETSEENASSGESIEVGVLMPLSGEAASYGLSGQAVLQIAEKEINDAGGVKGKNIKLAFEDGGCNANDANKAINNLISIKKVKVIIGGFCSSETLTSAPVVEQNKVVLLSPGSSAPSISTAGDFVFRNYPSDNAQGEVLAQYAAKKGYKKTGVLVEEQPYTEGINDTFTAEFTKLGGTVSVEKFTKDASDFRTQITKLQAEKVDVFFVDAQTPVKADLIVQQLVEAGVKGPFLINDQAMGAITEFVEKHKDHLEGSVGAEVPYDKANPGITKLQEAYKASTGKDIQYLSYMATYYDSLFIIKEAIDAAGEDPVKIKDYLYTVKGRKGLAGTLSFDSNGDPGPEFRHKLRIIKAGKVEDFTE